MGSEALRFNEKTMRVLQRSAMFSGFALENIDKVIMRLRRMNSHFRRRIHTAARREAHSIP